MKPEPNRALYIEILRRQTPEQRLSKALELEQLVRELSRAGVKSRNPGMAAAEVDRVAVEQILRWRRKIS